MIDFQNASYVKLGQVPVAEVSEQLDPLLVDGEQLFAEFKGMRDYIAFSSKRIIAVNVQGITGKKKDFTSLPFSKVQAFSIETAGTFDLDAELELWLVGERSQTSAASVRRDAPRPAVDETSSSAGEVTGAG